MTHLTFKQGVKECIPTLLGYAGVGLSFGIVAASQNFSVLEIILLCLIIYAGAAQFIICTLVLIVLCGVVTLLVRVIPFVMISRVNLSAIVIKWLSFIPITLFTALIIDGVIQQHDYTFGYTLNLPYIIAIVPTVMLAIFTRSLTVTIIGGIFVIACLRLIF